MALALSIAIIFGILAVWLSVWYINKLKTTGKAPIKQLLLGYLVFVLILFLVIALLLIFAN